MIIDVKRAVSDNRLVYFSHYRDGELWYETAFGEIFPVPIDDVGNAVLTKEDKALLFMRYMRRWNSAVNDENQSDWSLT